MKIPFTRFEVISGDPLVLEECRERVSREPEDAGAQLLLAAALDDAGRATDAIPVYRKALELLEAGSPQGAGLEQAAHFGLGCALNATGNRNEARAEWIAVTELAEREHGPARRWGIAREARKMLKRNP